MRYKIAIIALVFVLCAGAALFDYTQPYSRIKDPDQNMAVRQVPDFTFEDSNDKKIHHISDFKNKTVLVNFWASWCPPCRREFAKLRAIARRHPNTLALVLLSEDDSAEKAFDYAHSLPEAQNIYVAWDGRQRAAQNIFQTFRYPETIVISPGGQVQHKIIGEISLDEIREINSTVR